MKRAMFMFPVTLYHNEKCTHGIKPLSHEHLYYWHAGQTPAGVLLYRKYLTTCEKWGGSSDDGDTDYSCFHSKY